MSLDVYLTRKKWVSYDEGKTHSIENEEVYQSNITHNLNKMASAADIYEALWRPDEIGVVKASQLIEPLTVGLQKLKDNPDYFQQFNSPNGWGLYKHFVPWVSDYLDACKEYPDSDVSVSR